MSRPELEVADIFRDHGAAWRRANAGHVSLDQMKVMSAIERCRTAALGGHVARCENEKCAHTIIAYNSCRNRHCPKCQGAAAREWLAEREAELLPVPYFHVVYTLPAAIRDIAYQNKAVIYDLLFKASAETTLKIAATPRHLGARIGFMSVLHTWGSALTHHPHVHMVVPGGGLSPDGSKWIACRPRYFLTVEVLSALFRRLFLEMLVAAHDAGHLQFFGDHVRLADKAAFDAYLTPLRQIDWVVYAKEPFAGPEQVLRYLSRYTHRIAISNRRLVSADEKGVTFKYKAGSPGARAWRRADEFADGGARQFDAGLPGADTLYGSSRDSVLHRATWRRPWPAPRPQSARCREVPAIDPARRSRAPRGAVAAPAVRGVTRSRHGEHHASPLLSSAVGSPRATHSFFWASMISSARSSLWRRRALSRSSCWICRAEASGFGPRLFGASAARFAMPICLRQPEIIEE